MGSSALLERGTHYEATRDGHLVRSGPRSSPAGHPISSAHTGRRLGRSIWGPAGADRGPAAYTGLRGRREIDESELRDLLARHAGGEIDTEHLVSRLAELPFQDLGFARIDHHRELRTGAPEVVFGEGKTPEQVGGIAGEILSRSGRVLVTRASEEMRHAVAAVTDRAVYDPVARTIAVDTRGGEASGLVAVVSAGTSDIPVAAEAAVTAGWMGRCVESHHDVGVAGLHRLLDRLGEIRRADAIVAVAGMDGALPSVLAGLVGAPVIAVPTSVGYGASFEGVGPLLTMLGACSPGVAVVNIDNGFGAGYMAAVIAAGPGRPAPG